MLSEPLLFSTGTRRPNLPAIPHHWTEQLGCMAEWHVWQKSFAVALSLLRLDLEYLVQLWSMWTDYVNLTSLFREELCMHQHSIPGSFASSHVAWERRYTFLYSNISYKWVQPLIPALVGLANSRVETVLNYQVWGWLLRANNQNSLTLPHLQRFSLNAFSVCFKFYQNYNY